MSPTRGFKLQNCKNILPRLSLWRRRDKFPRKNALFPLLIDATSVKTLSRRKIVSDFIKSSETA